MKPVDPQHNAEHRGEDGVGLLLSCTIAAVLAGMLWVLIILAVRWVLELPPPSLVRLAAVVALCAGSGLVFAGLAHLEITVRPSPDRNRGRRPAHDVAPPDAARASTATTDPPQAGGRAIREVCR
jgi:hypothetical protein